MRCKHMMQAIVLLLALFLGSSNSSGQTIISSYSRKIASPTWTYYINQTTQPSYHASDGGDLVAWSTVEEMVSNSVAKIMTAINQHGQVLTPSRVYDPLLARTIIEFEPRPEADCGDTYPGSEKVLLNAGFWRSFDGIYGYDLETTILHELVHVFLGGGHPQEAGLLMSSDCNSEKISELGLNLDFTLGELYNPKLPFKVSNLFEEAFRGGSMKVAGTTISLPTSGEGAVTDGNRRASAFPINLERVSGQVVNGHLQGFTRWSGSIVSTEPSVWISPPTDPSIAFNANYARMVVCNVNLLGPFGYFSGDVKLASVLKTAPANIEVFYGSQVRAELVTTSAVFENVELRFTNWSPGGSSNPITDFPTGEGLSIVANFGPHPLPPANLLVGGTIGSPVSLSWAPHTVSSGVSEYQIWRKVKPKNLPEESPILIATLPRSVSSYIDYDYVLTSGYTDALVSYDVRAHYSMNGVSAYADPSYIAVFAGIDLMLPRAVEDQEEAFVPAGFRFGAYPNPFNPSTTLYVELMNDASVVIEAFDLQGRNVAELWSGHMPGGIHTLQWKPSVHSETHAASGTYLVRIAVTPNDGSAPFSRHLKVVLMR